MRGVVRRSCTAGLITAVLMAGLAACTGDSGTSKDGKSGKAAAKACANGTFTWSHITKRDRLTGVSAVERLGKGGGSLENSVKRVYTPRPVVRAEGPAPSAAEVLFSLGKKIGEIDSDASTLADVDGDTWAFTDVHTPAPTLDDGPVSVDGPGRMVQYAGVREVAADFRYACPGGKTVAGHARSWTVDSTGVVDCDESVDTAIAREAARHSCEAGAPAAERA